MEDVANRPDTRNTADRTRTRSTNKESIIASHSATIVTYGKTCTNQHISEIQTGYTSLETLHYLHKHKGIITWQQHSIETSQFQKRWCKPSSIPSLLTFKSSFRAIFRRQRRSFRHSLLVHGWLGVHAQRRS